MRECPENEHDYQLMRTHEVDSRGRDIVRVFTFLECLICGKQIEDDGRFGRGHRVVCEGCES